MPFLRHLCNGTPLFQTAETGFMKRFLIVKTIPGSPGSEHVHLTDVPKHGIFM